MIHSGMNLSCVSDLAALSLRCAVGEEPEEAAAGPANSPPSPSGTYATTSAGAGGATASAGAGSVYTYASAG